MLTERKTRSRLILDCLGRRVGRGGGGGKTGGTIRRRSHRRRRSARREASTPFPCNNLRDRGGPVRLAARILSFRANRRGRIPARKETCLLKDRSDGSRLSFPGTSRPPANELPGTQGNRDVVLPSTLTKAVRIANVAERRRNAYDDNVPFWDRTVKLVCWQENRPPRMLGQFLVQPLRCYESPEFRRDWLLQDRCRTAHDIKPGRAPDADGKRGRPHNQPR